MMKTLHKTLIASALSGLMMGAAWADDPAPYPDESMYNMADAMDTQLLENNNVQDVMVPNQATIDEYTGSNAQGNMGFNVGAGSLNVQDNAAAIAAADMNTVFGGMASAGVDQTSTGNTLNVQGGNNTANITDEAFSNAAGNMGVNVAAGSGNAQKNTMAMVSSLGNAGASTTTNQTSSNNISNGPFESPLGNGVFNHEDDASIDGNAFGSASGNMGVNTAAGTGNMQSNALALATSCNSCQSDSEPTGMGVAHTDSNQLGSGNTVTNVATTYTGTITDTAFQNATGNVGANVAAGAGNMQNNAASISYGDLATVAAATNSLQTSTGNTIENSPQCPNTASNTASISGNAFENASGNIGVNVAAGSGNLQSNTLSLSSSCNSCISMNLR